MKRFEFEQNQMGTHFRIVVYAPDELSARAASTAGFDRIEALEDVLSDYREESELARACATAAERPTLVSRDLYTLLDRSLRISRQTDGAFDITVKPLVRLWKEARQTRRLPEAARLSEAASRVGFENVLLNPRTRTLRFRIAGIELDLGGIGKGFAADEALAVIRQRTPSCLVDAGGDLRLGAAPPGRAGWTVAVEDTSSPCELVLADCAIATSGDLYQSVEIDGTRYSHIVDPRTGIGLTRRATVTVVAPDGTLADGLATALSVLEPSKALEVLERFPEARARISLHQDGGLVLTQSEGFPP